MDPTKMLDKQADGARSERERVIGALHEVADRFDAESLQAGKLGLGEAQSTFAKVCSCFRDFAESLKRGEHWDGR